MFLSSRKSSHRRILIDPESSDSAEILFFFYFVIFIVVLLIPGRVTQTSRRGCKRWDLGKTIPCLSNTTNRSECID